MVAPAWAIPEGPELMVGILHTGVVSIDWARAFRTLQLPQGTMFSYSSHWPFDVSRNKCCEATLQYRAKWLLFLDSDVVPEEDAVTRLMSHGLPIVQGVYPSKVGGNFYLVMRRAPQQMPDGHIEQVFAPVDFRPGEMVPVDTVATGLLLIHSRVLQAFKNVGLPWFEWTMGRRNRIREQLGLTDSEIKELAAAKGRLDKLTLPVTKSLEKVVNGILAEPEVEGMSEDFIFGDRAKHMGFPLFVDTAVHADHVTANMRIRGPGSIVMPVTP